MANKKDFVLLFTKFRSRTTVEWDGKSKFLSQEKLAELLGVTASTVHYWETTDVKKHRFPDRNTCLAAIKIMVEGRGITQLAEANDLLKSADMYPLNEHESKERAIIKLLSQENPIAPLPQTANTPTEAEYQAALKTYLTSVINLTERVVFRGIKKGGEQVMSLKLDDIYLPLAAQVRPRNVDRREPAEVKQPISMQELLTQDRRLVVTGAPGCGKTTVLYFIAHTLARTLTDQPTWAAKHLNLPEAAPIPILIPLSRYHEYRQQHQGNTEQQRLSAFISEYLKQVEDLPHNFWPMLRARQRSLILLLDGLDEVPDEHERAVIAQVVERLASEWVEYRFVVTCRIQAYNGRVVFRPDKFTSIEVQPLAEAHVHDLVEKLYRAIAPPDCEKRIENLKSGITNLETRRAEQLGDDEEYRLVTTPLMVRMLLIVHYNGNELPDRRAELYHQVVRTILIADYHPDAEEGKRKSEGWEMRLELLRHLAFSMHCQEPETDDQEAAAGREIEEKAVRQELQKYLKHEHFKPEAEAKAEADKFIKDCRQRGGLLEQRAGYYRFSHLSFQEFLAACYLIDIQQDLVEFITEQARATNSWWREPILLAVGYVSIERKSQALKLIRRLAGLDKRTSHPDSHLSLALAVLAALAFLEWDETEQIRQELAHRLAALVSNPHITDAPAPLRAEAGRLLARLGDPREGVVTLPPALTDGLEGPFWYGEGKDKRFIKDLEPFKAGLYPITNAQYQLFVDSGYGNPNYWPEEAKTKGYWQDGKFKGSWDNDWRDRPYDFGAPYNLPNHPVVGVSWYEAVAFCNWLTEWLRGQAPLYLSRALAKDQQKFWQDLLDGKLWARLPTEAEWERLARGDDGRKYPWGNECQEGLANTSESSINSTCAVGLFPHGASPDEVYDCAGNVWEWCADWSDKDQTYRVLRGGSWNLRVEGARCACRLRDNPDYGSTGDGFRLVVSPCGATA